MFSLYLLFTSIIIYTSLHCVKSVHIRSFFWSLFSRIWTEYGVLPRKSPYSVQIRENKDQKNSVFEHFWRSVIYTHLFILIYTYLQGRRNGFQSGGAMEHWKVLSAAMVDRQERFPNSRQSRITKTIIFWPWWQPFNSFCFETLSFLPLSPFFLFATQKNGGPLPHRPPRWCRPWLIHTYVLFILLYEFDKIDKIWEI